MYRRERYYDLLFTSIFILNKRTSDATSATYAEMNELRKIAIADAIAEMRFARAALELERAAQAAAAGIPVATASVAVAGEDDDDSLDDEWGAGDTDDGFDPAE